jgi:hypothetical protein
MEHNFHVEQHFKSEVESTNSSYSPAQSKVPTWRSVSAKSVRKTPYKPFVKVVEGSLMYNFAIYHIVHLSSKLGRKTRPTWAKPKWTDACRAATSWPRCRARPRAPRHVDRRRTHMSRWARERWFVCLSSLNTSPATRSSLKCRPDRTAICLPDRPQSPCYAQLTRPTAVPMTLTLG